MTLTIVNSTSNKSSTTAVTSLATGIPWIPVKRNVLILRVGISRGAATAPALSLSTNGTGWVLVGSAIAPNTTSLYGGAAMWIKISDGSESNSPPTIASTQAVLISYTVEEWPSLDNVASGLHGIDTSLFPEGPTAPATYTSSTSAGTTLSSNARTMAYADEAHFTVYGGRGATTQAAPTWGGGAAASSGAVSSNNAFCYGAMSLGSGVGTVVTHTAQFTNSVGGPVTVIGTVTLRAVVRPKYVGWGTPLNAP